MLMSLMDGLARPASELAQIAGIAPSTASAHLQRLTSGGLVCAEPRGRHRYFRLAGEHVAEALEVIAMQMAPPRRHVPTNALRDSVADARTCYHHLAGRLGVAWLVSLEKLGCVDMQDGEIALTTQGSGALGEMGLILSAGTTGKTCLDWTERRYHLGGRLGAQLTEQLFSAKWIARRRNSRAIRVTATGRRAFAKLGVAVDVIHWREA